MTKLGKGKAKMLTSLKNSHCVLFKRMKMEKTSGNDDGERWYSIVGRGDNQNDTNHEPIPTWAWSMTTASSSRSPTIENKVYVEIGASGSGRSDVQSMTIVPNGVRVSAFKMRDADLLGLSRQRLMANAVDAQPLQEWSYVPPSIIVDENQIRPKCATGINHPRLHLHSHPRGTGSWRSNINKKFIGEFIGDKPDMPCIRSQSAARAPMSPTSMANVPPRSHLWSHVWPESPPPAQPT